VRVRGVQHDPLPLDGDGRRSIAPRWSPDGRQVAFLRDEGDGWLQIALVDRDGERARTFTSEPLDHSDLAWSPDGRWIAYVASAPGQRATLFLIDGDKVVFDSWTIANYLEDTYPDRPSLFGRYPFDGPMAGHEAGWSRARGRLVTSPRGAGRRLQWRP